MKLVSRYQPLKHYKWGESCDGWNFVDEASLSVKLEHMPAGTAEEKHYHEKAQQFFFILKGQATFELNEEIIVLKEGEGLHIPVGTIHCINNNGIDGLEFMLCSQPSTLNDRVNCNQS